MLAKSSRKTKASALEYLYLNLIDALIMLSQHPAIPAAPAHRFKRLALFIAPLVGLDAAQLDDPRPGIEHLKARDLLIQLGLAMANVLENRSVPVQVWNEISEEGTEVEYLLKPEHPYAHDAARLRGVVIAYAAVSAPCPEA